MAHEQVDPVRYTRHCDPGPTHISSVWSCSRKNICPHSPSGVHRCPPSTSFLLFVYNYMFSKLPPVFLPLCLLGLFHSLGGGQPPSSPFGFALATNHLRTNIRACLLPLGNVFSDILRLERRAQQLACSGGLPAVKEAALQTLLQLCRRHASQQHNRQVQPECSQHILIGLAQDLGHP